MDLSSLDAPLVQPRTAIFTASLPADCNMCPHTLSIVQQYQQKFTDRRNIFLQEYSRLKVDTTSSSSKYSHTHCSKTLLAFFTQGSEEKLTQGCPKISAHFVTSCCKRKMSQIFTCLRTYKVETGFPNVSGFFLPLRARDRAEEKYLLGRKN